MMIPKKNHFSCPRLVIAAPSSGHGKTTATLALISLMKNAGYTVATFKCGPDYLDPTWHEMCSGMPCYNLDTWMMGYDEIKQLFVEKTQDADIALIEGVMGFYDGAYPRKDDGSTASVAKLLDAPVALVVNVRGMARSCAALVHGFATFDSAVRLTGVLCNGIGSDKHRKLLEDVLGKKLFLGGLVRTQEDTIPSRHLGLYPASEVRTHRSWEKLFQTPPDTEQILNMASCQKHLDKKVHHRVLSKDTHRIVGKPLCRIGIAKDKAFFFLYQQHLDMLEEYGAQLVFFSPLEDKHLPDVQGLYIPGGYPELHSKKLSANTSMLDDIRCFAHEHPIYAECGGLMYMMEKIETVVGEHYPMVGILEGKALMKKTRQALGYVEVETQKATLLGSEGTRFRGHQFRYFHVETSCDTDAYRARRPRGEQAFREGFTKGNVLASYIHAHWASNPSIARSFVMACR